MLFFKKYHHSDSSIIQLFLLEPPSSAVMYTILFLFAFSCRSESMLKASGSLPGWDRPPPVMSLLVSPRGHCSCGLHAICEFVCVCVCADVTVKCVWIEREARGRLAERECIHNAKKSGRGLGWGFLKEVTLWNIYNNKTFLPLIQILYSCTLIVLVHVQVCIAI